MKDRDILALYRKSHPEATAEARMAYGETCRKLALNLLENRREADDVTEAALASALTDIPGETSSCHVGVYLLKRTRRLALDSLRGGQTSGRNALHVVSVVGELSECTVEVGSPITLNGAQRAETGLVSFFRKLPAKDRDLFVCRYFYGETMGEISRRFNLSETMVAASLAKSRKRFRAYASEVELYADDPWGLAFRFNQIPDAMVLAAHNGSNRWKKWLPWLAAAVAVAVLIPCYPYLREIINTDLTLREPDWNLPGDESADDTPDKKKPSPPPEKPLGVPVSLGNTTLTATAVTDTTLTLTVVKKDNTPIYAMIYDRRNEALGTTEKDYKVDGVAIRNYTIKLSVDGGDTVDSFPNAPGTYEIVVDFASLRNGTYPMLDILGIYAYIGENGEPVAVSLDLTVPEPETEAPTATSTEE